MTAISQAIMNQRAATDKAPTLSETHSCLANAIGHSTSILVRLKDGVSNEYTNKNALILGVFNSANDYQLQLSVPTEGHTYRDITLKSEDIREIRIMHPLELMRHLNAALKKIDILEEKQKS